MSFTQHILHWIYVQPWYKHFKVLPCFQLKVLGSNGPEIAFRKMKFYLIYGPYILQWEAL